MVCCALGRKVEAVKDALLGKPAVAPVGHLGVPRYGRACDQKLHPRVLSSQSIADGSLKVRQLPSDVQFACVPRVGVDKMRFHPFESTVTRISNNMRSSRLHSKLFSALLAALAGIAVLPAGAGAMFFDLRGRTPAQSGGAFIVTGDGMSITISSGREGQFTSGATTFGYNSTSALDDAALIDGGSGFAEQFAILSSEYVLLESLLISHFDAIDHGNFNIKKASGGDFALSNGVNPINAVISGFSANYLTWTGDTSTGGGRGFSLDGFTARLVGSPTYQAGDFNNNKRADAADYVAWRNGFGTSYMQSDYSVWRSRFGQSVAGSGAALDAVAVPESSAMATIVMAALLAVGVARGRGTRHECRA